MNNRKKKKVRSSLIDSIITWFLRVILFTKQNQKEQVKLPKKYLHDLTSKILAAYHPTCSLTKASYLTQRGILPTPCQECLSIVPPLMVPPPWELTTLRGLEFHSSAFMYDMMSCFIFFSSLRLLQVPPMKQDDMISRTPQTPCLQPYLTYTSIAVYQRTLREAVDHRLIIIRTKLMNLVVAAKGNVRTQMSKN